MCEFVYCVFAYFERRTVRQLAVFVDGAERRFVCDCDGQGFSISIDVKHAAVIRKPGGITLLGSFIKRIWQYPRQLGKADFQGIAGLLPHDRLCVIALYNLECSAAGGDTGLARKAHPGTLGIAGRERNFWFEKNIPKING